MGKWFVLAVIGLVVVGFCGIALAEVTPNYPPVECYLTPDQRTITTDNPAALFHGEWGGGATGTYQVYIGYGDGTYESFSTTSYSADFYHHYNTFGKSPGYTWTVTLKVTNGNTAYDYSTVVLQ